jgi:UDP-glucuronate 4-epimerase
LDEHRLDHLFEKENFEIVINLAAREGVRYSIDNPKVYVHSNIVGFINIFEAFRRTKIKHLIYASSSSVYGKQQKIPFSETDTVDHPISLYAETKKSNELMAHV